MSQHSSSSSSSPEPPEPMDLDSLQELGADKLDESVREVVGDQAEEEEVDLRRVAGQLAEYLLVDSKQDVSILNIDSGAPLM